MGSDINTVVDIFSGLPVDYGLPRGAESRGHEFELQSPENKSLALAKAERFDQMCSNIPWGEEDPIAFGEMLRGLIITFIPQNRFHLEMLTNVAACQWTLDRVRSVQRNVFENGKEQRGRHGLPIGTIQAFEWMAEQSELLRQLERAVSTYQRVRGRR